MWFRRLNVSIKTIICAAANQTLYSFRLAVQTEVNVGVLTLRLYYVKVSEQF